MNPALEAAQEDLARAKRASNRAEKAQARAQAVVDALDANAGNTSEEIASIAAKGLAKPKSLTAEEIRAVCASALSQKGPTDG